MAIKQADTRSPVSVVRNGAVHKNWGAIRSRRPVIKILGIGEAGCKAVSRMYDGGVPEVEYYCLSTDYHHLDHCAGPERVRLGIVLTQGLGSKGVPEIGRRAAKEGQDQILQAIRPADLVLIVAGMGGGTGTGAAPVVAALSREAGAHVVAAVTQPFSFEAASRHKNAEHGIRNLKRHVDTLVLISHERLAAALEQNDESYTWDEILHRADSALDQSVREVAAIGTFQEVTNGHFSTIEALLGAEGACRVVRTGAPEQVRSRAAA